MKTPAKIVRGTTQESRSKVVFPRCKTGDKDIEVKLLACHYVGDKGELLKPSILKGISPSWSSSLERAECGDKKIPIEIFEMPNNNDIILLFHDLFSRDLFFRRRILKRNKGYILIKQLVSKVSNIEEVIKSPLCDAISLQIYLGLRQISRSNPNFCTLSEYGFENVYSSEYLRSIECIVNYYASGK